MTLARPPLVHARRLRVRASSQARAVALVYHGTHVTPPAGVVVPQLSAAAFEAHLRVLRADYDVVPVADLLVAAARRRRGGRLPVAITFDDDLPSHLDVVAPILRAHRVPATFFLTGIGLAGGVFWWQLLQAARDRGAEPGVTAAQLEQLAPVERRAVTARLEALAGPDHGQRTLNADEIRRLVELGFTIGFHTRGHDRLSRLADDDLHAALRDGRAELEAAAGAPITTIAYPYGDADARVAAAAADAGFTLGFGTAMAPVTPASAPMLLPRPEILAPTPERFAHELTWTCARGR